MQKHNEVWPAGAPSALRPSICKDTGQDGYIIYQRKNYIETTTYIVRVKLPFEWLAVSLVAEMVNVLIGCYRQLSGSVFRGSLQRS